MVPFCSNPLEAAVDRRNAALLRAADQMRALAVRAAATNFRDPYETINAMQVLAVQIDAIGEEAMMELRRKK